MDDGVLVPWKKNRPEDTKSALDLLQADRGGLYLDSRPGVHASVIELDFASLFPSIIATRNISPETLNCSCCQPPAASSLGGIVPLHPDQAANEFRDRTLRSRFGHGLFPLAHEKSLPVPGLNMHTCGRTHGFLGRVVAPIIERRRRLKQQHRAKGDAYDLQQNALKGCRDLPIHRLSKRKVWPYRSDEASVRGRGNSCSARLKLRKPKAGTCCTPSTVSGFPDTGRTPAQRRTDAKAFARQT